MNSGLGRMWATLALGVAIVGGAPSLAHAQHVVTEDEAGKLTLEALTAAPPRPVYRAYYRPAMAVRMVHGRRVHVRERDAVQTASFRTGSYRSASYRAASYRPASYHPAFARSVAHHAARRHRF